MQLSFKNLYPFIARLKRRYKRNCTSIWLWQGINQHRQLCNGIIRGSHKTLMNYLALQKISPLKIEKGLTIRLKDLEIFWEMLATLLEGNLTLFEALNLLYIQHPQWWFLKNCLKRLQEGQSFNRCLRYYPNYFSMVILQLIKVGENTGKLPEVTRYVAQYLHEYLTTKRRFLKILIYPSLMLAFILVINCFFLFVIFPQFQTFFADQPLPKLTYLIFQSSHYLKWLLPILFPFTFSIIYLYRSHWFRIPILNRVMYTYRLMSLTQILHLTLASGVNILNALKLIIPIFPSAKMMVKALRRGITLSKTLTLTQQVDPFFTQMVKVGEMTGKLPEVFAYLFLWYKKALIHYLENLNIWLEPAIMLLISFLVGILAMGIYLPIIQLGNMG